MTEYHTSQGWCRPEYHDIVDVRHVRNEEEQYGRVVEYCTVSVDSKTLTVTGKGTGVTSGRPVDEVLVYDRK